MKTIRRCLGTLLMLFSVHHVQTARSTPITYTLSGLGSGSLGGVSFTNTAFTISALADTSQISQPLTPLFRVTNSATTISVKGMPIGTLLTNTVTLDFQNPNASEANAGIFLYYQGPRLLSVFNSAFQTYDLSTSFAPHFGNAGIQSNFVFPTTAGDFFFSSVSSASFAASIVPEPSAIALLGFLAWAVGVKRRRENSPRPLDHSIAPPASIHHPSIP